jgi:hypothetical protein
MDLVDTTTFSPGFPKSQQHEVIREHLSNTIEKMLLEGIDVVVVEGEVGLGATTLLAQFARRRADRTVSVFIVPASRFAYAPSYLRTALGTQIMWLLDKREPKDDLISETDYRDLVDCNSHIRSII